MAYLCEFPTLLGGERSLLTFLAHRKRASVSPVVVAPPQGPLADVLSERGYPHVVWPDGGLTACATVAEALASRDVDVIHANSLMTADAAVALGRLLNRPAAAHVRDIMKLSAARRDRLNELAALVAVSNASADWLRAIGVHEHRMTRIYNAVDVAALRREASPGSLRRELGISETTPLVGCIGQIALRKGQDLFLDAAAIVAGAVSEAQFVIVGERYSQKQESRDFEAALHARAAEPPLAGRVHFLGCRDDVPSIMSDLDVVVVPSRQEPLSRVLLEALAMEVPAIATAVGGSPEILAEGQAGLLVPPDEPEQLAEAIERLLTNEPLRRCVSRVGLHRLQDAFAPEAQANAIGNLYCRIAR